jgi:hypothetical protein
VLALLQLECFLSCNLSDKNYKIYISRVATEVLEELQLKWLSCCNWCVCGVTIEVLVELQQERCRVAIRLIKIIKITCLELQLKCLRSCN